MTTKLVRVLLVFFLSCIALSQQSMGGDILANNCGLNCSYSTIRLFGLECDFSKLANEMGLDDSRVEECSFLMIKKVVEKRGLKVIGHKANSTAEMFSEIPTASVVIARTKTVQQGFGVSHFVLIIPAYDEFVIFDPSRGKSNRYQRSELVKENVLADATGEYLVVTESKSESAIPQLSLPDKSVDLGEILPSQDLVIARILVRNVGLGALKISDIRSACGCVDKIEQIDKLMPGEFGEIKVHFRKQMLPLGDVIRQVAFNTNDSQNSAVVVPIKMSIKGNSDNPELRIFPAKIGYGRISIDTLLKKQDSIRLIIPGDGARKQARVSVRSLSDLFQINLITDKSIVDHSSDPAKQSRSVAYAIKWIKNPPLGRFESRVEISVFLPEGKFVALNFEVTADIADFGATDVE